LVGEFFKVRTKVDRDLTIVSRVDQRLGLIKNLGRHRVTDEGMKNCTKKEKQFDVIANSIICPH
jgi:hypothetical protein